MAVLTPEAVDLYRANGYLLVAGLIPSDVVARGAAAYRRHRAGEIEPANAHGAVHKGYDDPDLIACYSPQCLAAISDLTGIDPAAPPTTGYTITGVQSPADMKLQPHIDSMHPTTKDLGYQITVMIFLNDISVDGGGTVVWPGSHRLIQRLLSEEPERWAMLETVNSALIGGALPIGEAVPTTPQSGHTLFCHSMLVHSGGINLTSRERYALNWRW